MCNGCRKWSIQADHQRREALRAEGAKAERERIVRWLRAGLRTGASSIARAIEQGVDKEWADALDAIEAGAREVKP